MTRNKLLSFAILLLLAGRLPAQVVYTENSAAQFNAGTHNSTVVSSSTVMLDYYGRAAGLASPGSDEWFNPDWKYRLALSVNSANASTLTSYPVAAVIDTQSLIAAGRMGATGADIRFTTAAAAGSAPSLPYYIESGLNTSSTKIWVRHPAVTTGANPLYLYYGSTSAAAASSMPGTFILGEGFTGANGSAPSSATWVSIESASPVGGSVRDIQANQLRLLFGSSLGTRYFGLRSASQYSFGAGRRYRADINARTTGGDSWSSLTLCQSVYTYSYDQDDWLRMAVHHTASGATYSLERSDSGTKTTLASGPVSAGMHGVDFLVTATSVTVLLDGAQVYSAANTLAFNSPYLYLEGATASSSLDGFFFDNVSVQPYSAPEPAFGAPGAEQGRRYPSGYFLSQVKDSGNSGSRFSRVEWLDSPLQGSSVTVQVRAHDTNVALATFTSVANGGDPVVSGRYVQYRLNFATPDPRYTAYVSSVSLTYGSVPLAPSGMGGTAQSESSIKWAWTDNSSGQYQEDGFKIMDASGAVKGTVGSGAAEWTETGLYANTLYARSVAGYNAAGTGPGSSVARYTLAVPPNVSCDKSTGTWLSGNINCSNLAGFGANGVAYYRYEWNQNTSKTWSGTETQWNSGTMPPYTAPTSGIYYLHVKSYNGDNVPLTGYQTYGPYWYDKLAPSVTGFTPSSSPWTYSFVNPAVTMTDAGDSKLYRARYRWTTSSDRPATGWQAYNYTISGDSGTLSYTQAGAGQWYLHVEADDVAGNTGYAYAGPYKIDVTNPTGNLVINDGDSYTASRNVTLALTYADAESGVKNLAYKNLGDPSYSNTELPQATTAWTLSAGDGTKRVYLQITNNAGGVSQTYKEIALDSRTSLLGAAVGGTASGVMGEPADTFAPAATLTWTPTGTPLSGKTVSFFFAGSTKTAVTDILGQASSSFDVPTASGTYIYNVSFSTDGVYSASASTGALTASQRSSTIITEDVNATSNNPFTAKATLKDFYTSALITGATVSFYFEGSTKTAVTNDIGVATVTFTAPVPVGFYDYTASFGGDKVYAAKDSVSRIGVGLRVTSLAVSPVSSLAKAVFNAQATLLDGVTPVVGSTVSFFFQGSTNTAYTDASGVAVATFTAPSSSGTYSYAASFPGDGTYAASSGNAALTVSRRPLNLAGEAGLGYVNASFQARAVLYDGITAQPVAGKPIVFIFESSSATVVTDAGGVSTAVFTSGALPRSSTCYYYFNGDAGYAFADSTRTVSIERRSVSLAASDLSALLNSSFTATAQLKDTAFTPIGIPGKTLTFSFGGSTLTAVTDSLGVASVTYQTGLSTGAFDYYVTFAQDSVYVAGNDTGTVTLDKRPSVLSAYPRFVFAFDNIQAMADLKDGITGELISSQTISFNYNGNFQSTTTGVGASLGRAYAVYAGTGVAGSYSYSATFPGTSLYSAKSSTASITVTQRSVNLSAFPLTAIWGTTFTATAEFRDGATNALVAGKPLRLTFSTSTTNSVTSGAGVAMSTYTAPASTGTFSWLAEFAGDQAYVAASSTGTITVTRRAATLTPIATSKYAFDSIILNATLMDEGNPVASKPLSFVFMGSTQTPNTNPGGLATTGSFASISTPGAYGYTVSFAGDTNYSAQSGSSTVTIMARPSNINLGPVSAIANSTVTLTATLLDTIAGTAIAGKTVSFTLQGAVPYTFLAVTNASGVAVSTYTASSITGPYTFSATFGGSANYTGTSSSNTLTVTVRPTVLEMADYYPPNNSTFTATAVLKDFASGATLASKNVSFVFMNSTKTVTTVLGTASTSYVTLNSTASFSIGATFLGDTLYAPASIFKTVYPGKRNTSVQTSDLLTAVALDSFTVTARLSDYDLGTFIAGSTLTFTFSSSTGTLATKTAYTNSTGTASVSFTAPGSTGSYTYSAQFPGNSLYNGTLNTSAIQVNRRTPVIEPSDLTGIPATSTFTATTLLRDGGLGVTLSTRTITFVFYSTKTAATNGVGVASTTFPAPVSTGTYYYSASFGGDALYNSATAYASLGVILKPTVLEVLDVPDAVVSSSFTATAKLRDIELGNALVLSPKTIRIIFSTATANSVTSIGVATATFIATPSTGTYTYSATFLGDSTYGPSTSTGTVTVKRRPVIFSVEVPAGEPYTLSTFTVKGTLVDGKTGEALANQPINIYFKVANTTQTILTDAVGIATASFYSGISSGSYLYSGTYDGNSSYNASEVNEQTVKSIKINPRPTSVQPYLGDGQLMTWGVYTFDNFNTTAIIQDNLNSNSGIPGVTVNFVVQGSTRTGVTAANGQASSSSAFPSIANAGTYPAEVRFDGNQTYAPSILRGGIPSQIPLEGFVRVYQSPSNIAMDSIQESFPDEDKVIKGVAHDGYLGDRANARPVLKGLQVRYRVSTVPCNPYPTNCPNGPWSAPSYANVDDIYEATATVHAPTEIGDYKIERWFATTSSFYYWEVTEDPRILRVGLRPTDIDVATADPLEVGAQMPITIKVKLKSTSQGDIGVVGKPVVITFNGGAPQTVTTVTGGIAQYTFAGLPVGNYTYTATFAGDTAYNSAVLSPVGNVSVVKNTTFLVGTPVTNVPAGNTFTAKATLNVLVGTAQEPAAGRTINFTFTGNADASAVTNAQGIAQVTFTSPQTPGEYIFTADLPTNANDLAASAVDPTRRVQVIQRHTSLTSVSVNPVYILDNFTSTATLVDLDAPPDFGVNGQTINFTLHRGGAEGDTSGTGTTAASPLGQATRVFLSPASAGAKTYTATFAGTTLYAPATAADVGVNVLKRPTVLAAPVEPTVPTNSIFTATVTLKDNTPTLAAPIPLGPGVQVKFVYNGVTNYGTTDASGVAAATFTAQSVANNYNCDVTFVTNNTYAQSTLTLPVHVIKRTTYVTGVPVLNQAAGAQFMAQATLTDTLSATGIPGSPINFVFTGGGTFNGSGTTDVSGSTATAFTAPLSTGTYNYTACFPGDATYEASCDNNNDVVVNISSTTLSTPDGSVIVNTVFFATATLKGKDSGLGLSGKTIAFTYDGNSLGNMPTNALGVAVKSFTPTSTGTFRLDVVFPGDPSFYPNASSATITVTRRTTGIQAPVINSEVGALFVASATLKDYSNAFVVGRTVDFMFQGVPLSGVTNAQGLATVTYTAPSPGGASYRIDATFAGDATYSAVTTSSTVNVAKRITQVTVASGSVTALEVFNATATLKWGAVPVPGKIIKFTFKNGSTLDGSATNASGQSFLQFNAGSSSGPWQLKGEFTDATDNDYTVSLNSTNTITVLPRPCLVIPDNISMSVYDTFTATATFMDVANLSTPAGKVAKIGFNWVVIGGTGTINSSVSDASGKITVSTGAPSAAGTYKVEGFFPGDATYAPSLASTATVTVSKRPTQLSVDDAAAVVDRVFTATATLRNNGIPLDGKYVLFTFEGKNFNAPTGVKGAGIAVATFTVTLSTGANQINAVFNGDSSYNPSNAATATVTAAMRPTFVAPLAATAVANKLFISSATLWDTYGSTVPGKTLSFLFDGYTISSVTNSMGLSTAAFTANVATGTYSIPVSFAGDYKYFSSSATLALTVQRRTTNIVSGGAVTVNALDVFYATGTLKDLDSLNLPAKPLRFVFQGSTFTKVTDGSGVSVTTFTAPAASGAYSLNVYFDDGDPLYSPSSLVIPVTVQKRPTAIALNPVTVSALDLFFTTATLTDPGNGALKVSTRPVTFTFGWLGTPSTPGTTDGVGVATASYIASSTAGVYQLTGTFAGDATYASTTTAVSLQVNKRSAFISGVFVSTRVLDNFTASAAFYDSVSSAPVYGRTMRFVLYTSTTQTANTNVSGIATTANFTAAPSSGTYLMYNYFDGDATYNPIAAPSISSVTLSRRNSSITLTGPSNIIINSSFTPTGTMYDAVSGGKAQNRTLSFLFQASTLPVVTDVNGLASAGYTASASSGTYGLQVSFAGDATYNPSFSSRTVTSRRYPTSLSGPAITVTMNEVLTATATLRDYLAATVPSKPVVFYFTSSSFTAVGNGSGVSYSTYAASVASGTYSLPVSFAGDALYDSTGTSLSVLVNKRTALLAPDPVTVKALDVFTATATLSDSLYPAQKVAGETVIFQFIVGASTFTNSGVTGADGVAVSTFAAPAATGAYQYRAVFAGSNLYYPLSAMGSVTVTARPVRLMQDNSPGVIDEAFTSTATLVDQVLLTPVAGRTVVFTYGASYSSATAGDGKAWAGFMAPSSSGTYQLNSSFAGDATYAATSSTGTLTVVRRPALMAAPDMASIIDQVFYSTLTLSDALNSAKVSGSTVVFSFAAKNFNSVTGAGGVAVSTFQAPSSSGTYYASISFPGNARYLPNGTTAQLLVDRRPSGLTPDPVNTRAGEVFTATATLKDSLNPASKPSGRPLVFLFAGSSFTVLTDSNGMAVSTFTAPPSSGTARIDVSFAGDARYQPSVSSATVTILRRLSAIAIEPAMLQAFDVFTATATLSDRLNPGVYAAGRNLVFSFRGSSFTSLTDAGGIAVSTYAGPASSGTYLIEASFAGDAIYDNSYASGTVTVTQRQAGITVADGSAYPFEVYLASASMKDTAWGTSIAGRQIFYTLNGVGAGAFTSAVGVATAPYTPPAAFGSYQLSADFSGDGTYSASAASGTVLVMQRPTSMGPADAATAALDVFVASATLYDVRLASAVAGKEAVFVFEGVTSTATTDANGLAMANFSAPVSSGVYFYSAEFHGDMIYAVSAATGAVTVGTRTTRVVARDKNANVGESFTLSAQLLDPPLETLPGYFVTGREMEFKFKDRNGIVIETLSGITNELGIATATFSPPASPDVYYYTANFKGDFTYSASSATAMVKVGLLTSLVAFDVPNAVTLEEFSAQAKLTDYLSTTLDDKMIRFKFISANGAGMTNADGVSGIASSTFTAPSSSGTYFYTAYFDGDAIYSPSNSTGVVKVKLRPSAILTLPAVTMAYSSFTASVQLQNTLFPYAKISGRDVDIVFAGSTVTVNTNGAGLASAQFFAPYSSGTYNFAAYFNGDDTYDAASSTMGEVAVSLRPTTMLSYNVSDLLAGSTFTARVQIKDAYNQPIPGLSVDFDFDGGFGIGLTNAQGIAETVFTAPSASGTYTYNAVFYGDLYYSSSTASGSVSLGPRPTLVFTSAISSRLGSPLDLSARLVDINSQGGIEGKTLSFYFEGSTLTALTDSLGVSSVSFTAPASTGVFSYGAEFVGDGISYNGSYSSSPVTIALNFTSLVAKDAISLKIYEPLNVEAVLRDYIGVPMTGLPVKFTFEGLETTSVTEGAGIGKATATFTTALLASTGTYNYTAEYAGDTLYVASSDTSNVVNVSRRESLLIARDSQSTPNKNVLVEARFYDNVNGSALAGAAIPGKTISFVLDLGTWTQTATALTSVGGVSTVTFLAPASTGTFLMTATFADDDGVYIGAVSSATFRIYMDDGTGAIKTKLKVDNGAAYITQTFVASGTLTATDDPVPGKPVLFEFFNGVATITAAGFTDAVGLATTTFSAPASSGTYNLTASFGGDMDFAAATGTGTVTVSRYPDSLTARDVSAFAGEAFMAKAVLRDEYAGAFVSGKTVVFEFFNGVATETLTALTSSTGSAEVSFVAPSLPGDYFYTARFAGDAQYVPASDTGSMLIASKGSSTFLIGYEVMVATGEVFSASATLTSKGYPVQGKPVRITFQGVSRFSTTTAAGLAISTFAAPASSGTFVYVAEFLGDPLYNAAIATGTVNSVFPKQPEPPVVKKVEVTSAAVTLAWLPVTVSSAQVLSYVVEQSVSLRGGVSVSTAVTASTATTSCTLQVDENQTTYIKIRTKLDDNQETDASATTRIVEIPSKAEDPARVPNYIYMSPENSQGAAAWVKIPGKVMDVISPSAPIEMKVVEESSPGFEVAYNISVPNAPAKMEADIKAADRRGVKLTIAYPRSGTGTSAVSGQLALYWYNGVEWIKIGGELDVTGGTISTYSRVLGQFALKAAPLSSTFNLTKVAPRIFTPDAPDSTPGLTISHVNFSFENPEGKEVTIRIFDITGALVRRNLEYGPPNTMFWNGKDQAGTPVKGGVYIYQIEAGDKVITGTVVVAK